MFGIVSKTEKFQVRTHGHQMRESHYKRTRAIYDTLSAITYRDIENMVIAFRSSALGTAERGRIAWQILAWSALFTPFKHPDRKFYLNTKPYIAELRNHPDKVYLFAVFVIEHPDEEVYDYINGLDNADISDLYQRYCVLAHEKVIYMRRSPEEKDLAHRLSV